jgi:hypothetical protein
MSLWESLLDDINALKNKKVPSDDDDAPRLRSLLRQVNELAGAPVPPAPAATKPIGDVAAGSYGSATLAGGQGGIKYDYEKKKGTIGEFHFGPVLEGGEINEETLKQEGFGADDYHLIMRNCQDYIDALRRSVLVPRPRRRPGV